MIVGFAIRGILQGITLINILILFDHNRYYFFCETNINAYNGMQYNWKNDAQKLYFRPDRDECSRYR